MNSNEEIRLYVLKELNTERKIGNPSRIEVSVENGIVTLSGSVDHYMDQVAAVEAAERVTGVKGVVQETKVELPTASRRNDEEIVRSACTAIEQNSMVPTGVVKVSVCDGKVTLEGEVQEEHQKIEAGNTVSKVLGVKGLINSIVVKPVVRPYDITLEIERTFQHMASHHAQEIHVKVEDSRVVLSGVVRAWIEKAEAEAAAREVPGVKEVENRLEVTPLLEGKEKPPVQVL